MSTTMHLAMRVMRPLLLLAAVLAVLAYFVFPTRTWLDQRGAIAGAEMRLDQVETENAELTERIELLQTYTEIERLARRDFNLIYPGEEPYAVLPPPPRTVTLPNAWPFNVLRENLID